MLHIREARYLRDHCVEVVFNDGRKGVADLSEALQGPIFEPLKETGTFAQFSVDTELETLVWPNGADLAPEYVYFCAFRDDPELQTLFKQWEYL
jgi:hypothetical protein